MKSIVLRFAPLLVCLSLLAGCTLFFPGCVNTRTYDTLAAVGLAVSTGIDEFAKAELRGQVPAATSEKIWRAYEDYRVAYNLAIDVAKLTPEKPATRDVLLTSRALLDLIESLQLRR